MVYGRLDRAEGQNEFSVLTNFAPVPHMLNFLVLTFYVPSFVAERPHQCIWRHTHSIHIG